MQAKRLILTLFAIVTSLIGIRAEDMTNTPLTLEATTSGEITFSLTGSYYFDTNSVEPVYYQINGGNSWTSYFWGDAIPVNPGDKVAFRADNATYNGNGQYECHITSTADVYVYGNIMSLVSFTDFSTLTTLTGNNAFSHLFSSPGEQSWEVAPNTTIKNHPTKDLILPATTLTNYCYSYMFAGCQGLTRAPELPATEMTVACYASMFEGCTGLTKAPALPTTEFTEYGIDENTWEEFGSIDCYMMMFKDCTSLTEAPELPAKKLIHGVYQNMFQGCTSLQKAPVLPAKKVADAAYSCMFDGCTSLNYVKCLATDISEEGAIDNWMNDVPTGGTFVKASSLDWPSGANGIPAGWKVENATAEDGDMGATPLTLEAITNGYLVIENPMNLAIKYRVNDDTWIETTADPIGIDIYTGDKVQFCGNNETYSDGHNHTIIHCEAECYIYGNIMSLISEDDFATSRTLTMDNTFAYMFSGDELLMNHPDNELVLPATKLSNDCYNGMFSGCKSLTTAPTLPATTMTERCYAYMFANCTGLTETPRLPANSLAIECYMEMFSSCTSLENTPDLPAKVLPINCYAYMFSGCEKLSYVKCLATIINDDATIGWLSGVADNGTFIKMSQMRNWPEGENGIPAGWTVQAATEADGDMGAVALTLEAVEDGIITISNPIGSMVNYQNISGDYWGSSSFTDIFQEFYVQAGDKIILSGNQPAWGNVSPGLGLHISSTNDVYVYGNVMSLVKSWDFADVTTLEGSENFALLFGDDGTNNTTIRNHPTKDIVLGATSLTESCYAMMFAGCEGLTRAPKLPATTLAPMCYHRMFGNCTGLTSAPILPAPVLETECYLNMFDGCTNLRNVKCLATDISAAGCTDQWLNDVAETGTFIMADDMSFEWPRGIDGIPFNWSLLQTSDMIPGDANLDWSITNDDATAISNYIIGQQPERFNEYAADLNGDGRITLADLINILKLILGQY